MSNRDRLPWKVVSSAGGPGQGCVSQMMRSLVFVALKDRHSS